jgi:hypothetical protein
VKGEGDAFGTDHAGQGAGKTAVHEQGIGQVQDGAPDP